MADQELTNSELGTYRTCPARWGFEYGDLLRPHLSGKVLVWGNTIHAGIDAGYQAAFREPVGPDQRLAEAIEAGERGVTEYHADYMRKLDTLERGGLIGPEEAQERYEDSSKLLEVAIWQTVHFFEATADDLVKLVFLGSEIPFRVPLTDARGRDLRVTTKGYASSRVFHRGKLDTVWWDPQMEQLVVDDHKTTDDLFGTVEKRIEMDPQMAGYQNAVRWLVKHKLLGATQVPDGCWSNIGPSRYNVIRRSSPKIPSVNKVRKNDGAHATTAFLAEREQATGVNHGLVSVAAIDTTSRIYADALQLQVERGLEVTEAQRDLFERLHKQGDRYFHRFEYFRTEDQIERWRQEIVIDAKRIRQAERLPVLRTRNPGACTQANSLSCVYKPVCLDDAPETRALYRVALTKHEEIGPDGESQSE